MPVPQLKYASLAPYKYQTFDPDFVKFTNIPAVERKKVKEEKPPEPAPAGEAREEDEKKEEEASREFCSSC